MIRTDYFGHDRQYRKRREAGQTGWDTDEGVADTLNSLAQEMEAPYLPHTGHVLEIGCGAGDLSLWLANRGFTVSGVDISPFAIEWAREKAEQVDFTPPRFFVGDVGTLSEFPNTTFDLVLDGQCLHCIIGDDRKRTLESVYRVLKPGGIFHLRTMCDDPTCEGMANGFDSKTRYQIFGGVAVRYLGEPESILEELTSTGFDVLAHHLLSTTGQTMLIADVRRPEVLT